MSATGRLGYVALLTAAAVVAALVVGQIWRPLLLAAVLAGGLWGPHERLVGALRGHRSVASLLTTLGLLLFVLIPLGLLTLYLVAETIQLVGQVRDIVRRSGPSGLVSALPDRVEAVVRSLLGRLSTDGAVVSERLRAGGTRAALALGGALSGAADVLLQLALTIIAVFFFFFLREGHRIVRWIKWAYPLPAGEVDRLLADLAFVSRNVVGASIVTAAVQGALAAVGYRIAGVRAPIVFGVLTMFVAMVPPFGSTAVGVPLAVLRYATGHRWQGIFLAFWALLVVPAADHVVRPLLMRSGSERQIPGVVLFFSLIGAVALVGPIGIVVGPVSVALLDSVLRLRRGEASIE